MRNIENHTRYIQTTEQISTARFNYYSVAIELTHFNTPEKIHWTALFVGKKQFRPHEAKLNLMTRRRNGLEEKQSITKQH